MKKKIITISQVLDAWLSDLELRETRSLKRFQRYAVIIGEFCGSENANELHPRRVYEFQQTLRQRYAAATTNWTVGALRSALLHADRCGLVDRVVTFPRSLPTNNARQGYLEHGEYLAIVDEIPETYRDPFRFLYASGWRVNEVLSLRWDEVSFESQTIRLDAKRSKNRQTRTIPFIGEIGDVLKRRHTARILGVPLIFHHKGGKGINISTLRKNFQMAAYFVGKPGLILHDSRRSSYRNMVRAGILPDVARKMMGWTSGVMPARYNIVDERDFVVARELYTAYLEREATGGGHS